MSFKRYVVLLVFFYFLNSCSTASKQAYVLKDGLCDEKTSPIFFNYISKAHQQALSCLKNNGREQDFQKLNQIINKPIQLRCGLTGNFSVITEKPNSSKFPGYDVNINKFRKTRNLMLSVIKFVNDNHKYLCILVDLTKLLI